MKRCPSCCLWHDRRGRACSAECEAKIRSRKSAATGGYRRIQRRVLAAIQKRERHRATWRAAAMTPDPSQLVLRVFGAAPDPTAGGEQE